MLIIKDTHTFQLVTAVSLGIPKRILLGIFKYRSRKLAHLSAEFKKSLICMSPGLVFMFSSTPIAENEHDWTLVQSLFQGRSELQEPNVSRMTYDRLWHEWRRGRGLLEQDAKLSYDSCYVTNIRKCSAWITSLRTHNSLAEEAASVTSSFKCIC